MTAAAQEQKPDPAASQGSPPPVGLTPLKVTVVISRYQGEKRTGSLPFTMWVNTGDTRDTNLRMTSEVPVPTSTFTQSPNPTTVASYQYKSIGTSIDCRAMALGDGRYRLTLGVQDSQVFSDATPNASSRVPATYQNFTSQSFLLMRDGQTVQYTTAADKASGEVIKVDVTLNVVK
jgi:hypothetical protein